MAQPENLVKEGDIMSTRKKDHIDLAFASQVGDTDPRFHYEPMLSAHPKPGSLPSSKLGSRELRAPIWISSMTGGTGYAHRINHNLARACGQYGLGMGLGSCRPLLHDDDSWKDFDVRDVMGNEGVLYANLGIAQLYELAEDNNLGAIGQMIDRLRADGLIIHVNPLQEWLQDHGDEIKEAPITTIKRVIDAYDGSIIVKEVGQGIGPASLAALMQLPLTAIEYGAHGGTNFSKLEMSRPGGGDENIYGAIAHVGQTAENMTDTVLRLRDIMPEAALNCNQFIVSGGIPDFLTGYYHLERLGSNNFYGQASVFLKYALKDDPNILDGFIEKQIRGLELAQAYLKLRVG